MSDSEVADPIRPARWLITGGCGFIGAALLGRLRAEGTTHVRVLDDLSRGSREALAQFGFAERDPEALDGAWSAPVELVVGGVEDRGTVDRAVMGADVVVHLAANAGIVQSLEDPHRDVEVNVVGTVNVLDAARRYRVSRLVLASSAAAVGAADPPISEKTLPRPGSPYGAGKLASEAYAGAFYQSYGLETVSLRFGNVFGPLSLGKDSVVARFVKRWLEGGVFVIDGDGQQTRDFIFIDDLTDAVVRAARVPDIGGDVFQVSTGRETSIREIAEGLRVVATELGVEPPRFVFGEPRVGDVRRSVADTSTALQRLGWRAQTSLQRGLFLTVRWFLETLERSSSPS